MNEFKTILLIGYVFLGLLLTAVAIPLIRRKVPPNWLYGFRVRRTLEDPRVWYEANAFAGKCLFWYGIGSSLACLALYFVPAFDPVSYAWGCLLITAVGLGTSVVLSFRFLNRLSR